jgi:hypothetical protein
MDLSGNPKELALLRTFAPFDGMKPESLSVFARKITRRQAPKGRLLFTEVLPGQRLDRPARRGRNRRLGEERHA